MKRKKLLYRATCIGCLIMLAAGTTGHAEEREVIDLGEIRMVSAVLTLQEEEKESLTEEEGRLLARIAMAEAEGEGLEGKALVMRVVLNRVAAGQFPDTVEGVIFQSGQFAPVTNGRWECSEPDEECYEALEMVLNGWDESEGATYFRATTQKSTWHSRNLTKLYEYGNMTFYKE